MEPQDSLVTSTGDYVPNNSPSTSRVDLPSQQIRNRNVQRRKRLKNKKEPKKKKKNADWMKKFVDCSCVLIDTKDFEMLFELLQLYTDHIRKEVEASYSKPIQCAKMKMKLTDVLGFVHRYCKGYTMTPVEKDELLKKLSVLTTMYMDMEIKASRRGKEGLLKITNRLFAALFIYLDYSPAHILDTVLRTRFVLRSFKEIYIPLFTKITSFPMEDDDMNYVRFLLIFKLWKQVVVTGEERNSINRLAVAKLSPPQPKLLKKISQGFFLKVLPTLPYDKTPELVTRFYMTSRFKLRDAINAFVELSKEQEDNELSSGFDSLYLEEEEVSDPVNSKDCMETAKDNVSTLVCDTSRVVDKPFIGDELPHSVKSRTDTILDNLWLDINNSSPASIEAIPPIESSHVNTPSQEDVSFKTNGVINQNEMFNTIETPEIKTGRSRNREIEQKRAKKPNKNTNLSMDQEVHNFLHEKDTIDSGEDSSLHSDEDNNPNEPMTFTMNLVGAKKSTDQNILNETSTKSKLEFQLTEFGSNSSKSSLVPQIAFNQEGLVVAKSQTSPIDLHNKANDAVPSGSQVLCNPIDYKSVSDYRRINLKRKIDNILAIKNNKSQQVTTASNIKEKPKCLFRLLELDKSLGKDEDGMEEDSDSSSDEDHEMSIEERKEISSKKFKQSGSRHGLNYIEPNVIICQNSARTSQVCPNPLTDRGTVSGETSNTFSQKQHTNTEIVVEEGFGTTLPNTVVCNTSDEKVLCIVAESNIHQIPKSESTRSDCMFQDLTFQTIDYSMDTLHKVNKIQTDIKNTEVTMDCDIIKDITNNHTLKQEFCSNSRETPPNLDQQSSMESKTNTKFCSTNEIYGSLNKDVIKHRLQFDNIEDPQMCTQERILTKTSSTGDSSFRLSHEFFEKESVLRNAQSINSCNKCGQAKRLLDKNVENHFSNEQMLREEFMSPVIQREPMTLKNWSLSSSYVNQENNDNVRVNCKQLKTPGVVNSSKHLETYQISRAFPDKIDVNKIELQVQAQHNIFTGDDDCESEGSNLVIDEDHDSIKELNEPNEETYFVLKNIDGSIDKRCSISDLRCYNMRRPKSTHVLPNENMGHAQVIPQNVGVDKSNRNNLKLGLSDSIFLNSPARNVISSCNNDERFYPQENRTFIPRTMYIQNEVNPKESLVNGQCFSSQNEDDSIMIQGNVSNCPPVKPTENQSGVPQNERLLSQVKSQNVQIHRTEQPTSNSFNSIQDSLHSPRKSPALLSEGFNNLKIYQNGELDSYYRSTRNDLSLTNSNTTELNELNQPSVSPNSTFQGSNNHIQQCERPNLLVSNYHTSSVEYNPHEEHVVVYIQPNHADYLNSSKIQQFSHNQGPTEVNEEMMQKVNISNTSYSTLDPLCLVANNKDHTREIGIDFEYFGVCEEVEVTSATEIGQNELCRTNETEDPDVSIAAEHSVTDSSVPLQALGFLYSPNKTNNPVCIDECNDQSCSVNSLELQQVSTDCSYPNDLSFDKERFKLHVKTVQVDYNLCSSQCEFKEFYMSQEVPQAIPVPYPLENRADKSPVRCVCEQCSDNHNILLNNYNILTNFRNAKVKPFNVCSNETQTYDKVQTSETDCNLPLKKRKTLTSSNNSEETKLTSYPNTPMISIAQLELTSDKPQNQTIVSKTQSKLKSPPSCSVVPQNPINYAQYTSPQQLQDEEPLCTRRRSTRRRKSTR